MDAVTSAEAASIGRFARWALLFCTLFGLAAMHTLGHAGMHGHGHGPSMLGAAPAVAPVGHIAAQAATAGCPEGHCRDGGAGMGWSVCLAVVSGLVAMALLALLVLRSLRARVGLREVAAAPAHIPRAPPWRRHGLRVASLAVLRI